MSCKPIKHLSLCTFSALISGDGVLKLNLVFVRACVNALQQC